MAFTLGIIWSRLSWQPDDALPGQPDPQPATLLRLLAQARTHGDRYHFFLSPRVMRAYPAALATLLAEGHDLDLALEPGDPEPQIAAARAILLPYEYAIVGALTADQPAPQLRFTRPGPTGDPLQRLNEPVALLTLDEIALLDPSGSLLRQRIASAAQAGHHLRTLRQLTAPEPK